MKMGKTLKKLERKRNRIGISKRSYYGNLDTFDYRYYGYYVNKDDVNGFLERLEALKLKRDYMSLNSEYEFDVNGDLYCASKKEGIVIPWFQLHIRYPLRAFIIVILSMIYLVATFPFNVILNFIIAIGDLAISIVDSTRLDPDDTFRERYRISWKPFFWFFDNVLKRIKA